jgi:hypothetical protein
LLLVVFLLSNYSLAQYQHTEYEVKAVYLYQFAKFVRWPGSGQDVFPICLLGYDPFGSALNSTVDGESLDGKKLVIRRIASAEQVTGCRILFISSSEHSRVGGILAALNGKPILTVSDMRDFADRGGMIQFVVEGERVRFEVNRAAAEQAGLSLSSDLLRVATAVNNNRPGP